MDRKDDAMDGFKRGGGVPFYYWLLGGLISGIMIGWFFHGVITMALRLALILGVIAVIVLGVYLWRKATSSSNRAAADQDIPEGNWRNIDPSGRK
jgi:hypothetical protein